MEGAKSTIRHAGQHSCKKNVFIRILSLSCSLCLCKCLLASFLGPSRIVVRSFLSENSDLLISNLVGCAATFETIHKFDGSFRPNRGCILVWAWSFEGRHELCRSRCVERDRQHVTDSARATSTYDKRGMCMCRITMEGNDQTSESSCTRLGIFPTSLLRYYLRFLYFHFYPYFISPSDFTLYQLTLYIVPLRRLVRVYV